MPSISPWNLRCLASHPVNEVEIPWTLSNGKGGNPGPAVVGERNLKILPVEDACEREARARYQASVFAFFSFKNVRSLWKRRFPMYFPIGIVPQTLAHYYHMEWPRALGIRPTEVRDQSQHVCKWWPKSALKSGINVKFPIGKKDFAEKDKNSQQKIP